MALVSDTVFSLLIVACGLLSASTIGFGVAWVRARERAIRAEQRLVPPAAGGDARFDRLEDVVASIAGQVEQLAEGQQFVTRLVEERAGTPRGAGVAPVRAGS